MKATKTTTATRMASTSAKRTGAQPKAVTKTAKTATKTSTPQPATTPAATSEPLPSPITSAPPALASTRQRDPRLPAPGTAIDKRDQHGNVRCTCTVQDNGIQYAGKVYPSISAAALAAAKDLGLKNTTQNGFTFWGLSKPTRHQDPIEQLEHAWQRYHTLATTAGDTPEIRAALARHVEKLDRLPAASA